MYYNIHVFVHISRVEYSFCYHMKQGTHVSHVISRAIDNAAVNFTALCLLSIDPDIRSIVSSLLGYSRLPIHRTQN